MHCTNHGDADLLHQMHEALRVQNPQWVGPDGESPICDDSTALCQAARAHGKG